MPLLGTLQVLQDPGQLHACLPLLADSPEFPLHSPGERKIGPKPIEFPSRAPPPSMTYAAPLLCNSTRQGYNGGIRQGPQPRQVGREKREAQPIMAAPPFSLSPGARWMAPHLASWPSSSNTTISSTQKMVQALAIWPAR